MKDAVTEEEIAREFEGSNFGHTKYRELLAASVLKKSVGYHCGYTVTTIMARMKLIGKTGTPTKRGREFLRHEYGHLMVVSG